jgi:hypothetical protein
MQGNASDRLARRPRNEKGRGLTFAFNPATTFGKITSMSIADQRKSLPIYKFRDQLID